MSEQTLAREDTLSTTGGSRTFAGQFVVKWTPSESTAELVVEITAAGTLLDQRTFTPGNASHHMQGNDGSYGVEGQLIAAFNSPPTSGTLLSTSLVFTSPDGEHPKFSGTIGTW
ncbi:hypothetical protein [Glycomyces arizonensis]|uniref:hypothetical protein n=1 Tax=Glycomyces arizonensis TaxID=256035 RepID=UPI0003FF054D|nr:hypothetical protein [Glycomyces arizonensis]